MKSSIEKRIKRHITGQEQTFFTVVSPGLEKICEQELKALETDIRDISLKKGGIEFKGRVHHSYHANLHLRTASRILMRIAEFKVTNFRQLLKKIEDFPWELYLQNGHLPMLNTTSKRSRLFHKEAINETILSGIGEIWGNRLPDTFSPDSRMPQQLFVRLVDDILTLSIDSSGDLLYKRGIKTLKGKAPIRETIAAAALKIAGYDGSLPLIDPMCGAGTFSIESAMIKKSIPPGWFRDFAFMDWPSFQPGRWAHEKREAEKRIQPTGNPFIFASDKDETACLQLSGTCQTFDLSQDIQVSCKDFFSFTPSRLTGQKGFVTINPPYGIRIGTEKESDEIFDSILQKLVRDYKGWKVIIIAAGVNKDKKIPFPSSRHPFLHGGLNLLLITGRIA
ncbi:MAG: hypothetical protein KJ737_00100 [Proteobacteria bacterium]|nr:hypothetical protein [Pseudomonadota bacterium]